MSYYISINVTVGPSLITVHRPQATRFLTGSAGSNHTCRRRHQLLTNEGRITAPGGVCFQVFERLHGFVIQVEVDLRGHRPIQSFAVTVVAKRPYHFSVAPNDVADGGPIYWAKVVPFEKGILAGRRPKTLPTSDLPSDRSIDAELLLSQGRQVFRFGLPRQPYHDAA